MKHGTFRTILLVTGFVSIPSQVLFIREFMLAFGGNELVIGLFLAAWMLLTAMGSGLAGRMAPVKSLFPGFTLFWVALSPLTLALSDLLRSLLFTPGVEAGPFKALVLWSLVLIPFCAGSGFLFVTAARAYTITRVEGRPGNAYALESIGSMAGGALLAFVLIHLQDNFRSAAIITLFSAIILFYMLPRSKPAVLIFFFVLAVSVYTLFQGSLPFRKALFPEQEILESNDTQAGNIIATRSGEQMNLYTNHALVFSGYTPQSREEAVHFALLQTNLPRTVLLVSGGLEGLPEEILRYGSVNRVDYVEIDPVIIELYKKYTPGEQSSRLNLIADDPRIFLRNKTIQYDAVIVSLPEPSSFQLNRYYSLEFLQLVKSHLQPGGVFSFTLPATVNYLNEGMVQLYSSLLYTCRQVFRSVEVMAGQNATVVASDVGINLNISYMSEIKQLKSDYIHYYINDDDLRRRSEDFQAQLQPEAPVNSDFRPTAVKGFYSSWAEMHGFDMRSIRWTGLIIFLLLALLVPFMKPRNAIIFTAGYSSSSLQVILILAYQVVYGQVMGMLGLFTATFMGGLALGSFRTRITEKLKRAPTLLIILSLIALFLPMFIRVSTSWFAWPVFTGSAYTLAMISVAFLTGLVFSITSAQAGVERIQQVYGMELAGAAMGAILTVLVIIPMTGVRQASLLVALPGAWLSMCLLIHQKLKHG